MRLTNVAAVVLFTLFISAPAGASDALPDSGAALAADVAVAATPAGGTGGDLGPTTDPPWNPPRPIPRREAWEQVILFPQRVVTLPLTAVGWGMERGLFKLEESGLLERRVEEDRPPKPIRFKVAPPGIADGAGLGAKAEVSAHVLQKTGFFASDVTLAHAATFRHYHDTRASIRGMLGSLDYQNAWRPQDRFYGLGTLTPESDLTRYATHHEHVFATLIHHWNHREPGGIDPRTWFSMWVGPRRLTTSHGRDPATPSIEQGFPEVVATTLDRRVAHLVYGVRFSTDWRVGEPHWSRGWRVLIESQRFDKASGALALGMTGEPIAQFTRTMVEFETGLSFMRDPRTIRLMGRVIEQGVTAGREHMEVADLSALGGRSGLAGFPPGRFHDLDLALVRLSYVFPLVRRLELDLHAESGAVFDDLWRNGQLSHFRQSFGFALRGRARFPLAAVGLDFSSETVRLRYTLGNPDR